MNEKIPGTNPNWNINLPDGDINSLVDNHGRNHDDGYNFDEKEDENELSAEILENNRLVNAAIDATEEYLGDYFNNTCRMRLPEAGSGSTYDGIKSVEELKEKIRNANWEKAEHENVMFGCTAYKTKDIPGGHYGIIAIDNLPENVDIIASEPNKKTGMITMMVSSEQVPKGPATDETWLIVGDEEGHDVVFTFHPGEPVSPSQLKVDDYKGGENITPQQAKALGFDFVKITKM